MKTLRRFLLYSYRYWHMLALSVASAAAFGVIAAVPTYLLKHTVDDIFIKKFNDRIVPFILLFMLFFLLKGIFAYITNYTMNWVSNKVINDLREELFSKLIYFPISYFRSHATGTIISYFLNDINVIQVASAATIKHGVRSLFEAAFLVTFAFYQNVTLTLLILVIGPLVAFTIRSMGRVIKDASVGAQREMGALSALLQQDIIGIRDIKAFNGEALEVKRFRAKLDHCFAFVMRNVHADSLLPALIECIAMAGGSLAFYVAIQQVLAGSITPGQLSSFVAAVLLAYQPLKRLINVYAEVRYGLAAAERIFQVLDTEYVHKKRIGYAQLSSFNDEITFNNVSFSYGEKQVLRHVSFSIKRGECIGLVGPSGAGKSTICDLLMGFIEPVDGSICIDGNDITHVIPAHLRNLIGYVGQQPFLFNDSIAANVSYATEHATHRDIEQACKQAHATEFIGALQSSYETLVGENGSSLSGGQKQRLTIARALLKDPEILIFDEATAALDQKTEHAIKASMKALKGIKTIIIITHRPQLLEIVDRTLLIHDEQVKEAS